MRIPDLTDRELLELAAQAADMSGWEWASPTDFVCGLVRRNEYGLTEVWNPLIDDGDALRLAVKLRMKIHHVRDEVIAHHTLDSFWSSLPHGDDPDAATRLVIVRAAADIGRASGGAKP